MITEDDLIEALKALAHPLRFRILTALAAGERNVGEIEQVTAISQPGLSQQLGVLRKAGLVDTRKEAKLVLLFHRNPADRRGHRRAGRAQPRDGDHTRRTRSIAHACPRRCQFCPDVLRRKWLAGGGWALQSQPV